MKKLILAMIAGATMMGAAQAEGVYLGAGVSTAKQGGTGDYKAGAKIFGGVDLDKTWAFEAGYTDHRSDTVNIGGGTQKTDGYATYYAAKGTMPLNEQVSLYGKLGLSRVKANLSSTGGVVGPFSSSDTKNGVYGGLGVQYNLSKQVALNAEYERYGNATNFGTKPNAWTLAARYNF